MQLFSSRLSASGLNFYIVSKGLELKVILNLKIKGQTVSRDGWKGSKKQAHLFILAYFSSLLP